MIKLFIASLLMVALLTACGRQNNVQEYEHTEGIVLTYANWNLGPYHNNELELQMLQSFRDAHPHITVIIDESITSPWTDGLATAISAGTLPDVFMIDDFGHNAASAWLLDITDMAVENEDFIALPGIVQEAVRLGGSVYAIPFAKSIQGYFVNQDLLRELGLTPVHFGASVADFLWAVRSSTDLERPSIGLNQALSFVDWYPGAVNPQLGFFAYDGFGFALNSPQMLEAVSIASELHSMGHTFEGLDHYDRAHFPAGYALGAFLGGQMAFFYGGSWHINLMTHRANFDWEFIGTPGGRAVVTLEILGISANTNHPEEAYLLTKWMGHGTEGNLYRLGHAWGPDSEVENLPVTGSNHVIAELLRTTNAPSLEYIYTAMDKALLDGHRVMPGYMQARFLTPVDTSLWGVEHILRYSITGNLYFPNYSAAVESTTRQQLEAALERSAP